VSDVSNEDATRILARMTRVCYAKNGPVEFKLNAWWAYTTEAKLINAVDRSTRSSNLLQWAVGMQQQKLLDYWGQCLSYLALIHGMCV